MLHNTRADCKLFSGAGLGMRDVPTVAGCKILPWLNIHCIHCAIVNVILEHGNVIQLIQGSWMIDY
jgi:hypothetical protein